MTSKELVAQMTLEEKASLCSGLNFWYMKSIERLGLPSLMVTDGPHGLRKQAGVGDHLGINESVPATCFPTACATSSSFDRELLGEMGRALGEECLQEDVAVLLGPGMNIKRSPLCGRNFEYISEDPYVTGVLTAALVNGIQSKGIGTSPKHFAANNQERCRMTGSSVVDERAFREIYLAGFEAMVKNSQPWTVMCSYNRINGVFASENKYLLTDILRDEWGFEGAVMTDWGAANDRVEGIQAGLDLEMPSSHGVNDAKIVKAVQDGTLDVALLDRTAERMVDLITKAAAARKPGFTYDAAAHHALARRAAAESAVLLKNDDNILPLAAGKKAAVVGAFAKTPRYQGAGSSLIRPSKMDNAHDILLEAGIDLEYAEGYSMKESAALDQALIDEACRVAAGKDVVLLFAGLPPEYESEGFDRTTLSMPESHNALIEAVAAVNPNVVVVLQCGAPVVMPWLANVKAVLLAYLGGQAGGGGCADVLTGKVNPGAKLAETFPLAAEDVACANYFPGTPKTVEYRESIFVGYRYYDAVEKPVLFPFGFGLSYTTFEYSGLKVSAKSFKPGDEVSVSVTVKNTGKVAGAEIVQLYVGRNGSDIYRAPKEMKGFDKVFLQPGESKTVTMALDTRSFAYYNVPAADWAVEGGVYQLLVGAASRDIRLQADIEVTGDGKEALLASQKQEAPIYFNLPQGTLEVPDADFIAVFGHPLPPAHRLPGEEYTINSTLGEIKDTSIGKNLYRQVIQQVSKSGMLSGDEDDAPGESAEMMSRMVEAMINDMPLRALLMLGGGSVSENQLLGMVDMMNGHFFKGVGKLLKKKK